MPEFVSVIVCELLPPVVTFPKLTAVGEAESCGCVGCVCVPVPLRAMLAGELEALLTIETLPVAAPAVVGLNSMPSAAD